MNPIVAQSLEWKQLPAAMREYRLRWLVPLGVLPFLALGLSFMSPQKWVATQALMVRNEAGTAVEGRGKFRQTEELKITQGTILEIAKCHNVLATALGRVGHPSGRAVANYPTPKDVSRLRKSIAVVAPNGTEFGKTEVFYLRVKDTDRARSVALARAVCDELRVQFQGVLNTKASSMVSELERSVSLAGRELTQASSQLNALEQQVGSDLAELRILTQQPSASSELRQRVVFIENELRQFGNRLRLNEELTNLLQRAQEDPHHLLAAPNSLLESQVALKRLKEGLVDAQLRKAQMLGNMSEEHPTVRAAAMSEEQIRTEIHDEVSIALRGNAGERQLIDGQIEAYQHQLDETRGRLERIAAMRTDYANHAAQVEHRTRLLQTAQTDLTEARARAAGADAASLISFIDNPDPGIKPEGPGKATLLCAGLLGGLFVGVGILILTVPAYPSIPYEAPLHHEAPRATATYDPTAKSTDKSHRVNGSVAPAPKIVDGQITLHFN